MKIFEKYPASLGKLALLDKVNLPEDFRGFDIAELELLADECREYLLHYIGKCGGHLGSSLSVVELTIALHYLYDTPKDKIVFDTGHQSYIHKILTGRKFRLETIRKFGGLAPFLDRQESIYDCISTGHAGTAVSVAAGLALADTGEKIVAVIGDGALTSGMTMEALNFFGEMKDKSLLVILNDNEMSISPNIGAIRKDYKGFFRCMGATYSFLPAGNDMSQLVETLKALKEQKGFHILHIKTEKGAGFAPALADSERFHSVGAGEPKRNYSQVFGEWAISKGDDERFIIISPAMGLGSGLSKFIEKFPEKFIDVGIAEQNAVAISAGLALAGKKPVVSIYSTFLQRAYDQVIHEVAINNLPVVFAVDRAGIVGGDGKTHQGVFDIAMLACLPNMKIFAPSSESEFLAMLDLAYNLETPVAVRYPRAFVVDMIVDDTAGISEFSGREVLAGGGVAILNFGIMLGECLEVARGGKFGLYDMRFIKPLDTKLLDDIAKRYDYIITVEEGSKIGGVGAMVAQYMTSKKVLNIGFEDSYIEHGSRDEMLKELLGKESIAKKIEKFVSSFQDLRK